MCCPRLPNLVTRLRGRQNARSQGPWSGAPSPSSFLALFLSSLSPPPSPLPSPLRPRRAVEASDPIESPGSLLRSPRSSEISDIVSSSEGGEEEEDDPPVEATSPSREYAALLERFVLPPREPSSPSPPSSPFRLASTPPEDMARRTPAPGLPRKPGNGSPGTESYFLLWGPGNESQIPAFPFGRGRGQPHGLRPLGPGAWVGKEQRRRQHAGPLSDQPPAHRPHPWQQPGPDTALPSIPRGSQRARYSPLRPAPRPPALPPACQNPRGPSTLALGASPAAPRISSTRAPCQPPGPKRGGSSGTAGAPASTSCPEPARPRTPGLQAGQGQGTQQQR